LSYKGSSILKYELWICYPRVVGSWSSTPFRIFRAPFHSTRRSLPFLQGTFSFHPSGPVRVRTINRSGSPRSMLTCVSTAACYLAIVLSESSWGVNRHSNIVKAREVLPSFGIPRYTALNDIYPPHTFTLPAT